MTAPAELKTCSQCGAALNDDTAPSLEFETDEGPAVTCLACAERLVAALPEDADVPHLDLDPFFLMEGF